MLKIRKTHILAGVCKVNKDTLTLGAREATNSLVYERFTYTIVRDVQRIKKLAHDRHHGTEGRYLCNEDG